MGATRGPTTRPIGAAVALLALVLLSACAADRGGKTIAVNPHPEFAADPHAGYLRKVALKQRHDEHWSCVPFARELSGIDLQGDAWVWWGEAARAGYARGGSPRVGAVMVFSRTDRLSRGHLSVVSSVVGPREILVDHANWGNSRATRGGQDWGVRVIDVSDANDWSAVRVWWAPADVLGSRVYPVDGFIYGDIAVADRTAG